MILYFCIYRSLLYNSQYHQSRPYASSGCPSTSSSNPNLLFTNLTSSGSPVFFVRSSLILTAGRPLTVLTLMTIFSGFETGSSEEGGGASGSADGEGLGRTRKSFVRNVPTPVGDPIGTRISSAEDSNDAESISISYSPNPAPIPNSSENFASSIHLSTFKPSE